MELMVPRDWTGRPFGASLPNDKWVNLQNSKEL
jgi:hypothetical protein